MPTSLEKSLSYLGFKQVSPSRELSKFIDCYWFLKTSGRISAVEYLHPAGGIEIIWNYGDTLSFGKHSGSDTFIIDGSNTFARQLTLQGHLESVGIKFKPAGAAKFLSLSLSEMKNTVVTANEIDIKEASRLYDDIHDARSIQQKVSIIESWLLRSMTTREIPDVVYGALHHLDKQKGNIKIEELSKFLGLGKRKLQRLFQSYVGLSPKEYSSNLRILEARNRIKQASGDQAFSLTPIAYDLGFHDQSHFIHEFKKIEGITPGDQVKNISGSKKC